jgi:hypothetical protein
LTSKLRVELSQFKISKGERTPNGGWTKGTKTGDDKWKESETNRGIEICVLSILDLLLLN